MDTGQSPRRDTGSRPRRGLGCGGLAQVEILPWELWKRWGHLSEEGDVVEKGHSLGLV